MTMRSLEIAAGLITHPPAASSRSATSIAPILIAATSTSCGLAAALPGSIPALMTAFTTPRLSCARSRQRQGLKIMCLEEIALELGYLDADEVVGRAPTSSARPNMPHYLRRRASRPILHDRSPIGRACSKSVPERLPTSGASSRKRGTSGFSRRRHRLTFVQDNHSLSRACRSAARPAFPAPPQAQAKLVRVSRGSSLRRRGRYPPGSPTYRQWVGVDAFRRSDGTNCSSRGASLTAS